MPADPEVYRSERLARSYAFDRPPIHPAIWDRIAAADPRGIDVASALDVGCGAGASSRALAAHAGRVTGVDLSAEMLGHAQSALPGITFVRASAQALPFDAATFDLVAAAGALNYCEPSVAVGEMARVLRPHGRFVAYDFATGRPGRDAARAAACFASFRRHFPPLPGYALDLHGLPYDRCALDLFAHERFDVQATMTAAAYVDYIAGETSVEAAVADGMDDREARRICAEIFTPLFDGAAREVHFAAVFILARKRGGN